MKQNIVLIIILCLFVPACQPDAGAPVQPTPTQPPVPSTPASLTPPVLPTQTNSPTSLPSVTPTQQVEPFTKFSLWVNGPHLRGANIYQRHVYPELDGPTYMGPGPFGPPFIQEDFNRLAALGANYVNISHPGLFSEAPPFNLDEAAQANLDHLLEMIAQADMFAVISFRTGPGRSEFTFFWGTDGDWFTKDYYNDTVWKDETAQQAWVKMWRYTAERYKNNPIVVGYDLMVEPNSNDIWFQEWDPATFYAQHTGSSYDWNQLAQRISDGVRQVDQQTPILIGGNSYSAVAWLPYLKITGDPYTVYTIHQYAPSDYTSQEPGEKKYTYPGKFDTRGDGQIEEFNRSWLETNLFAVIEDFTSKNAVPLAANEFGVRRWASGAALYMNDLMDLFESHHMNSALWEWSASWPERGSVYDDYTFLRGANPQNHQEVDNPLLDIIRSYWNRNQLRPSNTNFDNK